jgi:hypothetical protein
MRTEFEFVLPRGYIDDTGTVHRRGIMRLATARDELQPLRDPTVSGPDDPRLTLLVLVRVIERLGSIDTVTMHEVEQIFAADLAYLQDFYGVINFGSDEDIDALLAAQNEAERPPPVTSPPMADRPETGSEGSASKGPEERPRGRRAAIQEVPSTSR